MDVKVLHEQRLRDWEAAKAILDTAEADKRELSAEEEGAYLAANTHMDALDKRIMTFLETEERGRKIDEALGSYKPTEPAPIVSPESKVETDLRSFLAGESRTLEVKSSNPSSVTEFRTLSKLTAAAGLNTVKASFYDQLIAHMIEVSGILMANPTVLRTNSGEAIQVPKTTAHSTAALIAEAGSITASDPTFGQVTLNAYKYAVLVQVSNELVTDTSVDLLGYLAMQCGRAVGNAFGVHAITGTGTAQPNGIVTAATLGVTGGAGVVGVFTADNLIDLFFSVIAPYRNSPSCAWLFKDSSLAVVRKLKDTTNQYLWQPSIQVGAPDVLLGKPVYTDPNIAATALSAKSVVFGDMSQYFVRMVDGIRFERSDEFAFSTDLVTFRCILRADGNLIDTTGAVKFFAGNAA